MKQFLMTSVAAFAGFAALAQPSTGDGGRGRDQRRAEMRASVQQHAQQTQQQAQQQQPQGSDNLRHLSAQERELLRQQLRHASMQRRSDLPSP